MNVYIRELVSSLAQAGVDCDVYVRRWNDDLDEVVDVEPGFRVVHVPAGPVDLAKEDLPSIVDEYADWVIGRLDQAAPVDAVHANYWLSGVAGHRIKHARDLPLVCTFHTLARVKAETGDPEPQRRIEAEAAVIGCADTLIANARTEADELVRLYGADPGVIEVIPPGVDHAYFSPGPQAGARSALGLGPGPLLLFVGRIQPLKGADVAVGALAELEDPSARLLIVGGASGTGGEAEVERVHRLAVDLGVDRQIELVAPQPHHVLSTYYRTADVTLVPSRSESFGLVALESAACGTPVVASDVGGLRTLVEDGRTGYLIEGRNPAEYAARVSDILSDPVLALHLGSAGAEKARGYTWSVTAARLRRLYTDLGQRSLVECRAA